MEANDSTGVGEAFKSSTSSLLGSKLLLQQGVEFWGSSRPCPQWIESPMFTMRKLFAMLPPRLD